MVILKKCDDLTTYSQVTTSLPALKGCPETLLLVQKKGAPMDGPLNQIQNPNRLDCEIKVKPRAFRTNTDQTLRVR